MEHSRSPSAVTRPPLSPRTWTSTWRGRSISFSAYTAPSPKAERASEDTRAKPASSSASESTRRMPFPPQPAAAGLRAHRLDGLGLRADEDEPRVAAGAREGWVFRQEPVAGMNEFRPG